jgi:hypothetical protein
MIQASYRKFYWKVCKDALFGFKEGELMVVDYQSGEGFVGAPEILVLGLTRGVASNQPQPEVVELPMPSESVQYKVGGFNFNGYHYYDRRIAGDYEAPTPNCRGCQAP